MENEFTINCTGDACTGDFVQFERATFSGSYRRPRFDGMVTVRGRIIKESYGSEKQQHTFTLLLEDGSKTRIKGRNLYANGCYRKKWDDENERKNVLEEKHFRGEYARAQRAERISGKGF